MAGGTLPDGMGFKNEALLNAAYGRLGLGHVVALREKYNAGYAVLPSGSPVAFLVIYRNAGYRPARLLVCGGS